MIIKPDKKYVGLRLREVKESLGLSFTEFGERIGVKRMTLNSYVRGENLAPVDVIEKIANLYPQKIGWFYYGTIKEYLITFIDTFGYNTFLAEHPNFIKEFEKIVVSDFDNFPLNDYYYPTTISLDEEFIELFEKYIKNDIRDLANKYITSNELLSKVDCTELVELTVREVYEGYVFSGTRKSITKETLKRDTQSFIDSTLSNGTLKLNYNDDTLLGKLINVLDDEEETLKLISILSTELIDKPFVAFKGGHELIDAFQSLRPKLIELYLENHDEEFEDWH